MTPMIFDHPLIQHKISLLRNKNTGSKEFRELVGEVSMLMCYEATRDLPLKEVEIETPVALAKTKVIAGRKLAFVPILRAGIGMLDGVLSMVPAAKVGHIGLYRDPQTLQPVKYYCKLPSDINEREVIVLDPMLATGGSAVAAIQMLKESGAANIKFMCIIAAPEGLNALTEAHPDVQVYCAALDEKLNDDKYIVPGLGDCGDRIFGQIIFLQFIKSSGCTFVQPLLFVIKPATESQHPKIPPASSPAPV
jgi:uracil phosphoribosyltransferase